MVENMFNRRIESRCKRGTEVAPAYPAREASVREGRGRALFKSNRESGRQGAMISASRLQSCAVTTAACCRSLLWLLLLLL